jgi:hypothetical protein
MGAAHVGLEGVPFDDPDPVRSSRYLRVKGELDFCDDTPIEGETLGTQLIDLDEDGKFDCFAPITTTTLPPEGEPPVEGAPPGQGGDQGGGNASPPPVVPPGGTP